MQPSVASSAVDLERLSLSAMCILSLRHVIKDYVSDGQPVRALDGVSLEVALGEIVALVGRSGCGKSTLLNLAGAMDFPTAGEVLAGGRIDRDPR